MVKRLLLVLAFACAAPPLMAAPQSPLDDPDIPGNNRYDRCLALARSRPSDALAAANAWQTAGGAAAAVHCQAMALVSLRRYAEAGTKLDALARDAPERGLRPQLYDQAGNAWLLALQAANAEASFTSALTGAPNDPDILTDRARARAMLKNWAGADADLSAALAVAPARVDILVLRSSARHAEGKAADARADIDRALQLRPDYVDAIVDRGMLKLEAGDTAGARADFQQVISSAPASAAAAEARGHLQAITSAAAAAPASQPVGH